MKGFTHWICNVRLHIMVNIFHRRLYLTFYFRKTKWQISFSLASIHLNNSLSWCVQMDLSWKTVLRKQEIFSISQEASAEESLFCFFPCLYPYLRYSIGVFKILCTWNVYQIFSLKKKKERMKRMKANDQFVSNLNLGEIFAGDPEMETLQARI